MIITQQLNVLLNKLTEKIIVTSLGKLRSDLKSHEKKTIYHKITYPFIKKRLNHDFLWK